MNSGNTFDKLPEYIGLALPKPEQRITSDGVYTRVWTDERIAAVQLPEPTVVRDMKINFYNHKGVLVEEMEWPKITFNISFKLADDWLNSFNPLWIDRYTFPDKQRQSRRKARRRNRAKRKR